MLIVGGISYLVGGLWLTVRLLRGIRSRRAASSSAFPMSTNAESPASRSHEAATREIAAGTRCDRPRWVPRRGLWNHPDRPRARATGRSREWFLQFAKKRSVATHTIGMAPLALDEPWLVLKGAGHYETGCRSCHGARATGPESRARDDSAVRRTSRRGSRSGSPRSSSTSSSTASSSPACPPGRRSSATTRCARWSRSCWRCRISMPPATSGSCTASEGSRDLAPARSRGELRPLPRRGRARPGIGGFPAARRTASRVPARCPRGLRARRAPQRHDASRRGRPESAAMRELADHYAASRSDRLANASPWLTHRRSSAVGRSRRAASRRQGVPSCADCHGPGPPRRNPAYPALAGQYADYLVLQLELFGTGRRGGSAYAHLMDHVAPRLRADQMRDVAAYYASLSPTGEPSGR